MSIAQVGEVLAYGGIEPRPFFDLLLAQRRGQPAHLLVERLGVLLVPPTSAWAADFAADTASRSVALAK